MVEPCSPAPLHATIRVERSQVPAHHRSSWSFAWPPCQGDRPLLRCCLARLLPVRHHSRGAFPVCARHPSGRGVAWPRAHLGPREIRRGRRHGSSGHGTLRLVVCCWARCQLSLSRQLRGQGPIDGSSSGLQPSAFLAQAHAGPRHPRPEVSSAPSLSCTQGCCSRAQNPSGPLFDQ